jgi:hypothetical protein
LLLGDRCFRHQFLDARVSFLAHFRRYLLAQMRWKLDHDR